MSWSEAYASLAHADAARTAPLSAEELERLATAAFMIGRAEDHLRALERAHHAHLDAGAPLRAVRCAIWLAIFVAQRGEQGRATGWLSRAQRLLAHRPADCVERGYLLVPAMIRHEDAGEVALAIAAATEAAGIADRFRDADLLALALHEHGLMLARQGEVEQGLALVDEAMVAVCAGELSPIVTGVLYCSVISGCQELYALRRAQEWTAALTRWCEQQPEMVAFTGRCLVHRAELMQLHGAWRDALAETRRARERFARAGGESHPSRGGLPAPVTTLIPTASGPRARATTRARAARPPATTATRPPHHPTAPPAPVTKGRLRVRAIARASCGGCAASRRRRSGRIATPI